MSWTIWFFSSRILSLLTRIFELKMLLRTDSASTFALAIISSDSFCALCLPSSRFCWAFAQASLIVSSALSLASERIRFCSFSRDSDIVLTRLESIPQPCPPQHPSSSPTVFGNCPGYVLFLGLIGEPLLRLSPWPFGVSPPFVAVHLR